MLDLPRLAPAAPLATIDLHEASALGIDKTAIDEYEKLVRQVFAVLGAPWQEKDHPRKPLAKLLPIGNGVSVETRPFGGVSGLTS